LVSVLIGGHPWSIAISTRSWFKRLRQHPKIFVVMETRARTELPSPVREWIIRIAQFGLGDYSVRARRPRWWVRRGSKFQSSGRFPGPMEPDA
jgi:hypothetical protein